MWAAPKSASAAWKMRPARLTITLTEQSPTNTAFSIQDLQTLLASRPRSKGNPPAHRRRPDAAEIGKGSVPGEAWRCLLRSAPAVGGEVLRSRHEFALSVATRQRPRLTPQFPHRSEEFRFGPPLRRCGADVVIARWVIVSGQPALPAISQRILRLLPVEAARQLLEQLAFRNAALRRKVRGDVSLAVLDQLSHLFCTHLNEHSLPLNSKPRVVAGLVLSGTARSRQNMTLRAAVIGCTTCWSNVGSAPSY